MITPFWQDVIKAYEWVESHPHIWTTIERDGMVAHVKSMPDSTSSPVLVLIEHAAVANVGNVAAETTKEIDKLVSKERRR